MRIHPEGSPHAKGAARRRTRSQARIFQASSQIRSVVERLRLRLAVEHAWFTLAPLLTTGLALLLRFYDLSRNPPDLFEDELPARHPPGR